MGKKITTHSNGVVETRETFYTEETVNQLKQQLEKVQQENKILKDIRFLERVVPANSQLHQLSNRECYIKGYENAISETLRVFGESYGKDKVKLITERDELLMDIEKVGGYKFQIEELKQQLVEKDKELIYMTKQAKKFNNEAQKYYEDAYCNGLQNQKAIAELEKVKMFTEWKFNSIIDVVNYIDQQIKELKGEHDE